MDSESQGNACHQWALIKFLKNDSTYCIAILSYIYIYIYPTPLLRQDMTQGQFLGGV